jgi:hypothetical protein
MSTKIYEAYRVREGFPLWPILFTIKREGQTAARARLAEVYRDIIEGRAEALSTWFMRANADFEVWREETKDTSDRVVSVSMYMRSAEKRIGVKPVSRVSVVNAQILADLHGDGYDARPLDVLDVDPWVTQKYGAQLSSFQRSKWNLGVSVAIRELGGRYYLIPYCDGASLMGGVLDFLREYTGLEEYGYWNNTDKPDQISDLEWDERCATWNRLGERSSEYVVLDIVSFHGFHEVSPTLDMITPAKAEESTSP